MLSPCVQSRSAVIDVICFVCAIFMPGNSIAADRTAAKTPPVPIMRTSELRPGMKGYGLTVFRGIKPERFDVEIVDVLKNAFPQHDLILVRCSHPIINKAKIIAGMSGSPIYINDKLIGALAYGWSFSMEPIAGVTPIEWMLEELAEPKPEKTGRKNRGGSPGAPSNSPDKKNTRGNDTQPIIKGLTHLRLPVYASGTTGIPAKALQKIRKAFNKHGLELLDGAGGSTYRADIGRKALVPGAAIGVSLLRGDIDMTGIGTLTLRKGSRFIAFGHPMLLSGQEISMPVVTAFIHGVMPTEWSSFKFGSASKAVGTLTQDRYPAIAGTIGRKCPMIPIQATVHNPTNGNTKTLKVRMIDSRDWSPMLFGYTTNMLLLQEGVADSDFIVNYDLEMDFAKYGTVRLRGMDMAWAGFWISEPANILGRIMDNPFGPLRPTSITLNLETIHQRIDARIQRAWLEQLEVQPGNKVDLHIRVQPYGSQPSEIVFPIRIPAHLDKGKYDILVGGGNNWDLQLPTPPAESIKDIFTQLKRRYHPTLVVAVLKLPSVGVGFKGQLFRQLPGSVFGTLVSNSSAGVSTFQDGIHFTHKTPWYLTGSTQRLKIIVKQFAEENK